MKQSLAALLCVLAVACGGDDAGPSTVGGVCTELVDARCARLVECDPALDAEDEADCIQAFGAMCCEGAACDAASTVDATEVSDCREALSSQACSALAGGVPPPCTGLPVDN